MNRKTDPKGMIGNIKQTFPHELGNGVSWQQSKVIDNRGSKEEEENARKVDAHIPWPDRVSDPSFMDDQGSGGHCFLDPKGFRHYLPVFMIQNILGDTITPLGSYDLIPLLSCAANQPSQQWSELNPEMQQLIAQFIDYMVNKNLDEGEEQEAERWQALLQNYWQKSLP